MRAGPARKRQLFAAAFLRTANATKAAIEAGYSPRTAHQAGHQLLTHQHVRQLLAEAQAAVAVTPERVVAELARLAFANMADFVDENGHPKPVHQLTRDQAAAIRKVSASTVRRPGKDGQAETVEHSAQLELADKRAALQLLGQHTGIFAEGIGAQTSFTLIVAEPRSPELRRISKAAGGISKEPDDD